MDALIAPTPLDGQGRPLDVIELRGLQVRCVVGLYPNERVERQLLQLDVALYLDTRAAAARGGLGATVDYGRLAGELRFLLESSWFQLLETAADALCRYVLAPPTEDGRRAQVQAATVRLCKPEALDEGGGSLRVHRNADEYRYGLEEKPFGRVDVIYEDDDVGIYRLRIKPGGVIDTHEHRQMDECELVMGSGLLLQGQPVAAGTGFRWPRQFPHRYENPQPTEQTILCVDRPRFIPEDEVEVAEPPDGLTSIPGAAYYPDGATVTLATSAGHPRD